MQTSRAQATDYFMQSFDVISSFRCLAEWHRFVKAHDQSAAQDHHAKCLSHFHEAAQLATDAHSNVTKALQLQLAVQFGGHSALVMMRIADHGIVLALQQLPWNALSTRASSTPIR